jgi:hypothetical protein
MTAAAAPQQVDEIAKGSGASMARTFDEDMQYVEQRGPVEWKIKIGMVPNMRVPGKFLVNEHLKQLIFDELHAVNLRSEKGKYCSAIEQISNVAGLPGIVKVRTYSLAFDTFAAISAACTH